MQLKINCVLAVEVYTPEEKTSPVRVAEGVQKLLNEKIFPKIKDVNLNIRMNMDDIRVAS